MPVSDLADVHQFFREWAEGVIERSTADGEDVQLIVRDLDGPDGPDRILDADRVVSETWNVRAELRFRDEPQTPATVAQVGKALEDSVGLATGRLPDGGQRARILWGFMDAHVAEPGGINPAFPLTQRFGVAVMVSL